MIENYLSLDVLVKTASIKRDGFRVEITAAAA